VVCDADDFKTRIGREPSQESFSEEPMSLDDENAYGGRGGDGTYYDASGRLVCSTSECVASEPGLFLAFVHVHQGPNRVQKPCSS
jgi:hypothetical protein